MLALMEHYRLRKYRGPEVWARVRIAYEEGQTGPEVARRYDVGITSLRKKARREGWSRKDQAAAADRAVLALAGPDAAPDDPSGPDASPSAPTRPAAAVAAAVARAATALAGGRAAEAAGLLRAAETLARVAEVDPAAARAPVDEGPLTPEQDAAREAEAKKGWDDMLDLIEAQADALARRMLAEVPYAPAVHSGFVHAWRAQHLGPEAAAADRDGMQARSAHRVPFHWDDDGQPLPIDQVRAMYYDVYRRQIRGRAGLPAVAPGGAERNDADEATVR